MVIFPDSSDQISALYKEIQLADSKNNFYSLHNFHWKVDFHWVQVFIFVSPP